MKNNFILKIFHFSVLSIFICIQCGATIKLPSIISEGMVLQRNSEVTIWGWADPEEPIKITAGWSGNIFETKTSAEGYWSVNIPTPEAGGPYTLNFKGYNELEVRDVLIGEVWLCSGQSNMEMSVDWGINNGEEEAALADHPNIRYIKYDKMTAETPQNNVPANWYKCSPATMRMYSATAYFFARRLQEDLGDIPIGLVVSAWGGSPAEVWIPKEAVDNNQKVKTAASKLEPKTYTATKPGLAYNAMIYPNQNYKIAGVIWYQGESNVGSEVYAETMKVLIESWRAKRGYDFPFYFAQIAPWTYGANDAYGALLRYDQSKVPNIVSNTGMIVTSDICTSDDIHPKEKKQVGIRLADLALVNHYKTKNVVVNGPLYKSFEANKNTLTVQFENAVGLHFKEQDPGTFEVAGKDGIYHKAKAVIKNNEVVLSSKDVGEPVNVRFEWSNTQLATMFNGAGLPASCFNSEK
ncbi:MAG: sialate O-acetylesterase [Saprospiraceae bacterium]|nr:sialate O-acetylesterase [Candidatus Brachybacter algidus]MBK8747880.1 sialate O-acetylesterase [Candidatus Brachybacter algidus]